MTSFSHLDEEGAARMVDVGGKAVTRRTATATGRVSMSPDTLGRYGYPRTLRHKGNAHFGPTYYWHH